MSSKTKYAVALTNEAVALLRPHGIKILMKNDTYFLCESIEPNGNYLFMKIEQQIETTEPRFFEVSIPHSYILYIVSFDSSIHPNFQI